MFLQFNLTLLIDICAFKFHCSKSFEGERLMRSFFFFYSHAKKRNAGSVPNFFWCLFYFFGLYEGVL